MLWADSHEFTNIAHFLKDVSIIDGGRALALRNETSQHGDSCCLSGTVMTEQGEDLSAVHLDVESFHSLEATGEGLLQTLNAQVVTELL